MMNLIKTIAINTENDSAIRYLVVDAVNNNNVINFYKRNGFVFLFESDAEELECLRNHSTDKSIIQQIKNICRLRNKKEKLYCKTRLMYFDLILLKQ